METIVVEAVKTKPKYPKFSSGSVLAGGKWLQVAKNVDISLFKRDTQINVDIVTNEKGYTSIVGVASAVVPAEVKQPSKRTTKKVEAEPSYEDNKNRRIQVQGILQGVIQSPATINFGDDVQTIAAKVLELTDLLIAGMDERV